jgi:hypothetical protein
MRHHLSTNCKKCPHDVRAMCDSVKDSVHQKAGGQYQTYQFSAASQKRSVAAAGLGSGGAGGGAGVRSGGGTDVGSGSSAGSSAGGRTHGGASGGASAGSARSAGGGSGSGSASGAGVSVGSGSGDRAGDRAEVSGDAEAGNADADPIFIEDEGEVVPYTVPKVSTAPAAARARADTTGEVAPTAGAGIVGRAQQQTLWMDTMTNEDQQKSHRLLAKWIFSSDSAFHVVENQQFKEWVSFLRPSCKVPSNVVIGGRLLDEEYTIQQTNVQRLVAARRAITYCTGKIAF